MATSVKPENADNQPPSVLAGREEMDFVNQFSTKIRTAMTASPEGEGAGKASESKPKDKSKPDNSKPGGTQDDEPGDDPKDDDEEDDDIDNGTAADDDAEDKPKDKPKDGEETDDDEDEDDDDEDLDDDDDEEATEDDLAKDARAALEKAGLKVKLADLPAEARPLVQKTLDHARAVVTRALQEARDYRKEEPKLRGELEFMKKHPAHFIAEMLESENGEEIEKQVNELLKGANSDTTKKALLITTKDLRKEVMEGIQKAAASTEKQLQRADVIESYVRTACRNLNLDYEMVVESVLNKLADKPDDARDLSQTELDAIIGRHQRSRAKLLGEKKVKDRTEEIRGRKRDRKSISPASKGGNAGTPPAPTGKKPPTNDAEFAEHMVSKLAGSRKK